MLSTENETLGTENQEPPNQIETQNSKKWNNIDPSIIKQMLNKNLR